MPSRWLTQIDFSSGELDPRALGRIDLERWPSSVALARNVLLEKTGAARGAGGWRYVQDVPGNQRVQLIGWQRDVDYVIALAEDTNLHLYDSGDFLIETLQGREDGYVYSVLFRDDGAQGPVVAANQTQTHVNTAAAGSQLNAFGRTDPPLSTPTAPGWSWSNGAEETAMISVAVIGAANPDPSFAIDDETIGDEDSFASSWSVDHDFSSDANLCLVLLSGEGSGGQPTTGSVVIDPGGAAIQLTRLRKEPIGFGFVELWGAFDFAAQSGTKSVVATFSAGTVAGSIEAATFISAARLPEARDLDGAVFGNFNAIETEITLPQGGFGTSSVGRIDTASDSEAMLFFHEDLRPHWLHFTEGDGWVMEVYPIADYPYHRFQEPGVTLDPSNTTGAVTLTTSAPHWLPEHVGSIVRFGSDKDRIEVTGYTSPTMVDATVLDTLPNHTATTEWDEQAWSDGRGWPVSGCWHQGRLVIGGARDVKNGLWFSKVGEIEADSLGISFDQGEFADDEAIWARLRADEGVSIQYVRSQGPLVILADGTEWVVSQQPVTPSNIAFERQASQGVARVKPADLDGAILYVRSTRSAPGGVGEQPIIYFAFDELKQRYLPVDLGVLGQHLIRNPVDMAAARGTTADANNTLFLANDDGTVAALHLPSVERPGVTLLEGVVEPYSLAVSAGRLYCAAGYNEAHRIFRLDPDLSLDASVTFNHLPSYVTDLGPYTWFVNQVVTVKGWTENDGWLVETVTADENGLVTVSTAVQHGEVGVPHEWRLRRLPIDASPATVGSLKSPVEARVLVADAIGVELGDEDGRVAMTLEDGTAPWDLTTDPATAFTGHLREHLGGWSEDAIVEVGSAQPWGARVLALNVKVEF